MKKVVKKLLGYLMILVLVVGMFSGVPAKAATLSEDSKSVSFNYQGVDTVIDQYLTKDGKTMWLVVDNALYSYDIASGVFSEENVFGAPTTIGTQATNSVDSRIKVFINDNTGMLVYAYNKYYDAEVENQIIWINMFDLESGENVLLSETHIQKASLDAVFCDDDNRVYVAYIDEEDTGRCKMLDMTLAIDPYYILEEVNDVTYEAGTLFLDFYQISSDGTRVYAYRYKENFDRYYVESWIIDYESKTITYEDLVSWNSSMATTNKHVEIIDDRYIGYYSADSYGFINDFTDNGRYLLYLKGKVDESLCYKANVVVEDNIGYVMYDNKTFYGYDMDDACRVSMYTSDDYIFSIVEVKEGLLLLKTDGTEDSDGNCTYYYEYVAFDDLTNMFKNIDLGEELGMMDRTKEEITKKFADAVLSPDSSVYASKGSSVAPYSPYVLTDSAKQSGTNLMNYYRYLEGVEEVAVAGAEKWENAEAGMVLCDIYGTYFVDGVYEESLSYSQPSDMDDEFYAIASEGANALFSSNTCIEKEKDLVEGYRSCFNSIDLYYLGYVYENAFSQCATSAVIGASNKSFGMVATEYDYSKSDDEAIIWPTAGYFPIEEIDIDTPWYFIPSEKHNIFTYEKLRETQTVEIIDVDTGETYESELLLGGSTVTFTPPQVDSFKDKTYKVIIKGFYNTKTGDTTNFEYTISFFSYKDVKLNIDGKEYTCDEYGNLTATETPFVAPDIDVSYRTHIQTFGWEGTANDITTWKENGEMSGTSGLAKRLEGINIVVNPTTACEDLDLGIQYTTHCQTYGWLPWSADGDMNGTEGEAKRLEAIKIQLTGEHAELYDVYYRVHAQTYGWLGWAKNGAPAGTAGYAKRLEGIQIVVVKKGESFNQKMEGITSARTEAFVAKVGESPIVNYPATSNTNPVVPGAENVNVAYRTHVQSYGWQAWKYNGQMSGTSGEAKRLEGINIELRNKDCDGGIVYTTHVQTYGWQGQPDDASRTGWKKNGEMSGTSGEAKRLEAICIDLTGEMAENYDIYYRVHAQTYGWLGWAKNGAPAGTAGYAKRLEGIQIVLVPKGDAAPTNYQGIVSANSSAYIEK